MPNVIVFCEGETEERFIKQVIAPSLRGAQVYLKPEMLKTSQDARGGAISYDRLKFYSRNALRQNQNNILSTFIDLYALDTDFPSFQEATRQSDLYSRVGALEFALHESIVDYAGCLPNRFVPHIQPHEFEGLLFSDVNALVSVEPTWRKSLAYLEAVKREFPTPEHINNSYETKPSRRLQLHLDPKYRKVRHGPLAAKEITLAVMEQQCSHFRAWVNKLRALAV